jgi:predicted membrane protein
MFFADRPRPDGAEAVPARRVSHLDRPRADGGPERVTDFSRLTVGLVIATLGVVFLLDAAGGLDGGRAVDRFWPLVLVVAGALTLLEQPPSRFRGSVLLAAGVVLLLFTTDVLEGDAWSYVWPAVLVVLGLSIVARWRGRTTISAAQPADEVVRGTAIFGGQDVASSSRAFRGAWLTTVFGGMTLDLRGARLDPDGASINATAVFGGVDVLVPRGWWLSIGSTPIFGGVEDETDHTEPPAADAPLLRIDALIVFGGVSVKHEK